MRRVAPLLSLPLLFGTTSCFVHDTTASTQTTMFVFANFTNPNVTVKINGEALGQLTRQYTGATDCASMGAVVTAGTMLRTTLELGETYDIEWSYNDGHSDSDELAATSDVIETECPFEQIAAPPAIAPQGP